MVSKYDTSVHEYGYCGHVCDDPGGPFDTYVCFLTRGHDDDIHQAVQVQDPTLAGLVNGAWTEDSTPVPGLVTLTPEALAKAPMRHMSPETEARVHERVDAVSESVQMLVWEYQMRTADSEAFNIMDFTVSLVRGCRRQHPDSEQALAAVCEQLAVAVQKLAAASEVVA